MRGRITGLVLQLISGVDYCEPDAKKAADDQATLFFDRYLKGKIVENEIQNPKAKIQTKSE